MAGPIPLFMLRTVLFPHMPLSLHVFEPRYREMMRDCMEAGTSFGVIAIRDGAEVGGVARPREVGTLARIVNLQRLEDGRMNLLVTGASRFRVRETIGGKPYLRADVEYLAEEDAPVPAGLRTRLLHSFERYVHHLQVASPGESALPELPEQSETLAYLVAATLESSVEARQQLLEAPSAATRMAMELGILRREADLLRRRVLPIEVSPAAFSAN